MKLRANKNIFHVGFLGMALLIVFLLPLVVTSPTNLQIIILIYFYAYLTTSNVF